MDDLEFRRTLYADPHSEDADIRVCMQKDVAKREFVEELRSLNVKLRQAAQVDIPDELAHRLILRQSITSHIEQQKRKNRWYLAAAASIAFVFGVSFTLWQQHSIIDLGENALAHVYHEPAINVATAKSVSLIDVNAKLANYGATLNGEVGRIISAKYCYFDDVKSLHLVVQSADGQVSLFVLPQRENYRFSNRFGDDNMQGVGMQYQKANLLMVGEKNQDLSELQNKLKQKLVFSA